MAVKKTTKKKEGSATPTKAEAKDTAPKKKAAKPKAAAPLPPAAGPVAETAPAAETAAATKPKAAPKKASAPKKAAAPAIKLSPSQGELLKKIGGSADAGYSAEKKVEERSIQSLLEKKLIKKGAKDKASGAVRYHISSAGKKHIS